MCCLMTGTTAQLLSRDSITKKQSYRIVHSEVIIISSSEKYNVNGKNTNMFNGSAAQTTLLITD